jgi:hypothetical protein
LKYKLGAALVVSMLLLSCAAERLPTIVTVRVADAYSGRIYLKLCEAGAKEPAVIDDKGNGETSVCSNGRIAVVVLRQTSRIYVAPEQIKVDTTGDGFAVAITAYVR